EAQSSSIRHQSLFESLSGDGNSEQEDFTINHSLDLNESKPQQLGNALCSRKTSSDLKHFLAGFCNIDVSNFLRRGDLFYAHQVFDKMPCKTTTSLIVMISGYLKFGNLS
ncbi:Pentatricopeptide repeat-containing protein, chloroplastic, partial [Cucurbita argyrosperma subsp. argyrosperma]